MNQEHRHGSSLASSQVTFIFAKVQNSTFDPETESKHVLLAEVQLWIVHPWCIWDNVHDEGE